MSAPRTATGPTRTVGPSRAGAGVRTVLVRLDAALGRVTQYRLVTLCLGALAASSLLLAATGHLGWTASDLLQGLVVLLVATCGSGWVIARLVRTRAHLESSVITALLLFFVLFPSSTTGELWRLAVTGLLASASKYVLAVRGRHLLNPAAAGAAAAGLLGIAPSAWWVATPDLLPVIAVTGLLVLRRTGHLTLGLTAVTVSTAIVSVRLAGTGQPLGTAVTSAVGSYPALFLVCFMLTEPLTLPPRWWQQLVEAALVAVLVAVPMTIGGVTMTPALALVVGNLLAFAAGQRRAVRLDLLGATRLTPTTHEITFRPRRPLSFRAGQYLELSVPHRRPDARGSRRLFSIVSSEVSLDRITVAIRTSSPGTATSSFKRALLALEPGARLRATRIGGDFVLPRDVASPLLLVAGGVGLTPFVSHLSTAADRGEARDVVVLHAVSHPDEVMYADQLVRAGATVVLVSAQAPAELPPGYRHVAADRVTAEVLTEAAPDLLRRTAYVSGPPVMVDAVRTTLHRLGVRHVRTDRFSGY